MIEDIGTNRKVASPGVNDHGEVERSPLIFDKCGNDEKSEVSKYPLIERDRDFHLGGN